jgi:propanol-preferring alcohol dehydrogenase
MPEKMRAMVLSKLGPVESNPLKLTEIDRHKIANPKEVLVKIEACGVCHSQLHSIEGDWENIGIPPVLPTVPGHEIVGKIVEVGSDVTKLKVGERVGITPLLDSCLDCQYCNEGKEYLCENMDVTGESMKGGYTEYITVSEDFATKVPDAMRPEYAAPLFCAGITAYKAVKATEPKKNKKIAVFGIGGVGHMAIQFAKIEGCEVSGVSRKEKHLEVAKKLGADNVFVYSSDQKQFLQNVNEKYGLFDAAIVFATVGKIPNFLAFEEKTIRGTLIGSRKDMEDVIKISDEHKLEVVTESFSLEQANEVLTKLKNSEIDARAVLIP